MVQRSDCYFQIVYSQKFILHQNYLVIILQKKWLLNKLLVKSKKGYQLRLFGKHSFVQLQFMSFMQLQVYVKLASKVYLYQDDSEREKSALVLLI